VAGFQHDRTVLAAALAEAERQKNDTIGIQEQAFTSALAESRRLDGKSAPASIGHYGDKAGKRGGIRRFYVASYNGNTLD
jgi:hypothetical protein